MGIPTLSLKAHPPIPVSAGEPYFQIEEKSILQKSCAKILPGKNNPFPDD
jgi:hypothetical protein